MTFSNVPVQNPIFPFARSPEFVCMIERRMLESDDSKPHF